MLDNTVAMTIPSIILPRVSIHPRNTIFSKFLNKDLNAWDIPNTDPKMIIYEIQVDSRSLETTSPIIGSRWLLRLPAKTAANTIPTLVNVMPSRPILQPAYKPNPNVIIIDMSSQFNFYSWRTLPFIKHLILSYSHGIDKQRDSVLYSFFC